MIKFSDLADYLNDEYPYTEDVFGLILDLVNGVTEVDELKQQVKEYKEYNG